MLSRPVLLFDGTCGFCRTWISRLRRWDRAGRIDYVPMQERSRIAGLPAIPDEALERAMHLVLPGGRVFAGGRAVGPLLGLLPGGWALRSLLVVPGAQPIVDRAYAAIAARRHRLGCGGEGCRWRPER